MRRWNWPYDQNLCYPSQPCNKTYFKRSRWNSGRFLTFGRCSVLDCFSHILTFLLTNRHVFTLLCLVVFFCSYQSENKSGQVHLVFVFFAHRRWTLLRKMFPLSGQKYIFSLHISSKSIFSPPSWSLCIHSDTLSAYPECFSLREFFKITPLPICTALAPSGCLHTVHKPLLLASKVTKGTAPPVSPRSWFNPAVSRSASFLTRPSLLSGKPLTALPCPDSSTPASTWTRLPSGALVAK